jgi:hypothetical protein
MHAFALKRASHPRTALLFAHCRGGQPLAYYGVKRTVKPQSLARKRIDLYSFPAHTQTRQAAMDSPKPRGRPRAGKKEDPGLTSRLHAALIQQAQSDALAERVKRTADQRQKKIEYRQLPAQSDACRDVMNTWDSKTSRCVQRVPTQRELEDRTLSYDQIAGVDGAPQRKSLVFSAIRSGSLELLKVSRARKLPGNTTT